MRNVWHWYNRHYVLLFSVFYFEVSQNLFTCKLTLCSQCVLWARYRDMYENIVISSVYVVKKFLNQIEYFLWTFWVLFVVFGYLGLFCFILWSSSVDKGDLYLSLFVWVSFFYFHIIYKRSTRELCENSIMQAPIKLKHCTVYYELYVLYNIFCKSFSYFII